MPLKTPIRGPKLLTKLLLLGVGLLVVPWLSYIQLLEMERLLIQGQQNAQLLMARGVSTLFNNRADLIDDLPIETPDTEPLYVARLNSSILIDGDISDWSIEQDQTRRTFPANTDAEDQDSSFAITLGEQIDNLYVYLQVNDDVIVYREPGNMNFQAADSAIVDYVSADGVESQLAITFSRPGTATVYSLTTDIQGNHQYSPSINVVAYVSETPQGYDVEFSMPFSMVDEKKIFNVSIIDVDDPIQKTMHATTSTTASDPSKKLNLVVFRSAETMRLVNGLGYVDAHVIVYDAEGRMRGESHPLIDPDKERDQPKFQSGWGFQWLRPILHPLVAGESWSELTQEESDRAANEALADAQNGIPSAILRNSASGSQSVMAFQPILTTDGVLGVVTLEQNIDQILSFQQVGLRQIVVVSLLALLVVLILAAGFSFRLAYRIRKLKKETTSALDERGRLTAQGLQAEVQAGDEIGDLARAVDDMIGRLHDHNRFIERMPRTLRHEINNPLNTLSTSLENLQQAQSDEDRAKYMQSARRGILRIGAIVQNLVDAANLEESLTSEKKRKVDVNALLKSYVQNQNAHLTDVEIVFDSDDSPLEAEISDFHIEQMLDKLIDNAVDFHRSNSPIKIQLSRSTEYFRIIIANRGPTFPEDTGHIFEMLVSQRPEESRLHFGLGLYVVRVIAEYHGGTVRALNLANNSGVAIVIDMALRESMEVEEEQEPSSHRLRLMPIFTSSKPATTDA